MNFETLPPLSDLNDLPAHLQSPTFQDLDFDFGMRTDPEAQMDSWLVSDAPSLSSHNAPMGAAPFLQPAALPSSSPPRQNGVHQQVKDSSRKRVRGLSQRDLGNEDTPGATYIQTSDPNGGGFYNGTANMPSLSMPLPPNDLPPIEPITYFGANRDSHEGFVHNEDFNITSSLKKMLANSGPLKAELTGPACAGQELVVGANQESGLQNYLVHIGLGTLTTNQPLGTNPISFVHEVPMRIEKLHWEKENLLVCAMNNGQSTRIQKYHLNRDGRLFTNLDVPFSLLDMEDIRDMAATCGRTVVIGNNTLHVINERGESRAYSCGNCSLSSAKWQKGEERICTVTTDQGRLLIFDARVGFGAPAQTHEVSTQGQVKRLFAHEFYTTFNCLVGGEEGWLAEVDLRNMTRSLQVVRDPYVCHIGDIDYNDYTRSFLVSGMTDFSYWKHDNQQAIIRAHSQGVSLPLSAKSRVDVFAKFVAPNIGISTNSAGALGVYLFG